MMHASRGITMSKDPQRRIRPIGDEAFAHFQDATSNLQFQCILLLMRDGGLRVGEVLGLHIQDLEFHRNGVVICRRSGLANGALAKGMVERHVYLHATPSLAGSSAAITHLRRGLPSAHLAQATPHPRDGHGTITGTPGSPPPYDQHLVQIMSVMGLRSVDALHLGEDCLEYDATGVPACAGTMSR